MVSVVSYSLRKCVVIVVGIVVLQCVEIYGEEVIVTTTISPSPSISVSDAETVVTVTAENVKDTETETIQCIDNIASGVSVCTASTIQTISNIDNMYPNGTQSTIADDELFYQYKIYPSITSSIDTDVLFTISLERSINTVMTTESSSQYVCDYIAINNILCNSCVYCTDDSYSVDCTNIVPYGRKSNGCETGATTLVFPLTANVFTATDITTLFTQDSSLVSSTPDVVNEETVVPTIAPTSPAPSSTGTTSTISPAPTTIVPTTLAPSSMGTTSTTSFEPTSVFVVSTTGSDPPVAETSTRTISPSPSSSTTITLNPVASSSITLNPIPRDENEIITTTKTLRPVPQQLDPSIIGSDGSVISGGGSTTTVRTRQPGVSPILSPPITSQPISMPPILETTSGIVVKPCKTFTMDLYTSSTTIESSTLCVNPSRSSTSVGGIYMNNDIVPSTPEIQTYYYNSTIYYYNDMKLLSPISILMERTNEIVTTGTSNTILDGICNYISINGRRCTGCTYCGNEQFTADCTNIVPYGLLTDTCQSSIPVVFPFLTSIFLPTNTLGNV